ncbi:MAG: hypothetical protein DRR08_00430 [Candidatus Parabeggiatoa sp. nov. 2]|nr:MAG: hypothetical protein B6247_02780 [Beggiatoa sp. 4572_84]RKZ64517.1 MAG: hypothetical protein DRR08_00430 [Gammaproteobacteria bacterium]
MIFFYTRNKNGIKLRSERSDITFDLKKNLIFISPSFTFNPFGVGTKPTKTTKPQVLPVAIHIQPLQGWYKNGLYHLSVFYNSLNIKYNELRADKRIGYARKENEGSLI